MRERREYRALFSRIVAMVTFLLIEYKQKEDADMMLSLLQTIPTEIELTSRVEHLFLEDVWLYQFENKKMGYKIVRRAMRILYDIGAINIRNHMGFFYNRIKNQEKRFYYR